MSENTPRHNSGQTSAEDNKHRAAIAVIVIAIAAVVVLAVLFIGGVFSPRTGSGRRTVDPANTAYVSALKGSWKIDSITTYEFDGSGKGVMHTAVADYPFFYDATGDTLSVDFESEKAEDSEYRYTLSGDSLTLTRYGKEYHMTKVN